MKRAAAVTASVVALVGISYGVFAYAHHDQEQPGQGNMPSAAGNPAGSRTEAGVCKDAQQVGSAAHITAEDETIASLEQFYSPSCDETYAHLEMEQSYQASAKRYNVTLGVFLPPPNYPPSPNNGDGMYGSDWEQATQRDFWFKHSSKNHCAKVDASVQTAYGEPIYDADTADPKGCRV